MSLPQDSIEPSVAVKIWLTKEETEAHDIKWLVPKHTNQSMAKQQLDAGCELVARCHLLVSGSPAQAQAQAQGSASFLWARPHSTPPQPKHKEMGFASSNAAVLSISRTAIQVYYSNLILKCFWKIMYRAQGKIYVQATREAWDPVIKGSVESRPRTSFSAE